VQNHTLVRPSPDRSGSFTQEQTKEAGCLRRGPLGRADGASAGM
jgi:hypothetical protein